MEPFLFLLFIVLCWLLVIDKNKSMQLYAWLRGYSWIVLRNAYQERYETYIKYDKEGDFYYCNVYPMTKVGYVILLPDNKVNPSEGSSYIKSWQYIVNRGDFKC